MHGTTHGVLQLPGGVEAKDTWKHQKTATCGDIDRRYIWWKANCVMCSTWKESNMLLYSAHKPAVKFRREIDSVSLHMTLCINTRVQRVLRNLSTTPARAPLSTADDTGSRSGYICVQCCPARRSKCEMELCMEWYTASPALLLNGCSGISGVLERLLSPAKVRSHEL